MDSTDWVMFMNRLNRELPPPEGREHDVNVAGEAPHFIKLSVPSGVKVWKFDASEIPPGVGLEEFWTAIYEDLNDAYEKPDPKR